VSNADVDADPDASPNTNPNPNPKSTLNLILTLTLPKHSQTICAIFHRIRISAFYRMIHMFASAVKLDSVQPKISRFNSDPIQYYGWVGINRGRRYRPQTISATTISATKISATAMTILATYRPHAIYTCRTTSVSCPADLYLTLHASIQRFYSSCALSAAAGNTLFVLFCYWFEGTRRCQ